MTVIKERGVINRATAIGEWGRPGARITLTDEVTGETLTTWPDTE
ncbi:hypothetical protein ACJ6WF_41195 [Streptomyces sp. MMS24-I2-30]